MESNSAWGFDADEAIKAQGSFRSKPEVDKSGESVSDESGYNAEELRAARIPPDRYSQIYELRRMFRL